MGACAPQALKLQLRKALSEVRGEVLTKRAKETLRVDALPALKRVVVPVLCLAGRFDQLIGKSSVRRIVAASPKAHVCWFDAPHMLLQMCPAEAAVEINNFCGLLSPRTCTV